MIGIRDPLFSRLPQTGNWKLETGNWKLELSWKLTRICSTSRRGNHIFRRPSSRFQIADACVAVGLAQLLLRRLHDQRMVQERRRLLATEQSRNSDLAAGRREQVDSSDHVIDVLPPVIDRDGELIRPVAVPIAQEHVAALLLRILLLETEPFVYERLDTRIDPETPAVAVDQGKLLVPANPGVTEFGGLCE